MTPDRFRRIDALVSRVVNLEPREREVYLDEACAGDGALRREVEALLACDEASGAFLERPAADLLAGSGGSDAAAGPDDVVALPPAPATVGRYVLERELGRGGMGSVWAAHDPELGRKVAIKLIRSEGPGAQEPSRRRRLLREAQALAQVTHPNVVAIHDVGTFEDLVFIAMEYVEGATLRDWLAAGRRSRAEIVSMFVQAGRGLAAAHARGIVHRDFKPENVWIGEDGRARVLDFGLARAAGVGAGAPPGLEAEGGEPSTPSRQPGMLGAALTEAGRLVGTPAYMAPEQLRGGQVDARTDQFSFCVALHQALAGELPFSGDGVSGLLSAIAQRRIREGTTARRVPAWLRRALRRGMSHDPAERFASMDRLLDELERRPEVTRRRVVIAGALALVAAAALPLFAPLRRERAPGADRIQSLAVLPLEARAGQDEASLAEEVTDALTSALARIDALHVISRSSVLRYRGTRAPPSRIARELSVDAVVGGTVARSGDRVRVSVQLLDARSGRLLWAGSYERDVSDIPALQGALAREIADRVGIPLTAGERARLASARAVNPLAYEAYASGRFFWNKRTAAGFQKALVSFEEAVERDPGYALAYAGLADTYNLLAIYELLRSEDAFPKARRAAMRALELDDGLAEAHTSLARYYENYERDWRAAEHEYRLAIALDPGYATGHDWYATFLSAQGRHEEALAEAERAHRLDPFSLTINTTVGLALAEAGQAALAVDRLRKTVEMDPDFSYVHFQLGRAYLFERAYADALAEFRRAVVLSPTMGRYKAALGHACGRAGRSAEALRILEELERGSPGSERSWADVAIVRAGLGQSEQAFAALEEALAHREWRLVRMNVEPMFDPLRADPRFAAMLRRMGLPP